MLLSSHEGVIFYTEDNFFLNLAVFWKKGVSGSKLYTHPSRDHYNRYSWMKAL